MREWAINIQIMDRIILSLLTFTITTKKCVPTSSFRSAGYNSPSPWQDEGGVRRPAAKCPHMLVKSRFILLMSSSSNKGEPWRRRAARYKRGSPDTRQEEEQQKGGGFTNAIFLSIFYRRRKLQGNADITKTT